MAIPVTKFETVRIAFPGRPDLKIHISAVPPDLSTNHFARDFADDRSICVPKTSGSVWFNVFMVGSGNPIASAVFACDSSVVRCDTVEVVPDCQRQGIASALYHQASAIFDAPNAPSDNLTSDGHAFWNARSRTST